MRMLPLVLLASLTGCASTGTKSPINYANVVGMIQTNWPTVSAAAQAAVSLPGVPADVRAATEKAIADGTPIVASLSATSDPTTMTKALADMAALVTAVPNDTISAQTKTDIGIGLSLLQGAASLAPLFGL